MRPNIYLLLIPTLSLIIWSATYICNMANYKYLFSYLQYEVGHISKAWSVIYWYYFYFSACKNCNIGAVAGLLAEAYLSNIFLAIFVFLITKISAAG